MNYFPIADLRSKGFIIVFSLILSVAPCSKVCAHDTNTTYIQNNTEYVSRGGDFSDLEENLVEFFFYVLESYFNSHLMYSHDLRSVIHYGETLSSYWYRWILDNITSFKIESDRFTVRIFYKNDTLLSLYKDSVEVRAIVETDTRLNNFIRLFDKNDVVIQDTNIIEDYVSQMRDILIRLHEQKGYELSMQMLPLDTKESEQKEYPIKAVLVYDNGALHLHPSFVDPGRHFDEEYKQHLARLSSALCSKYNAAKIIFTVPVLQ